MGATRNRPRRFAALVLAGSLAIVLLGRGSAAAHAEVRDRAPGADQTLGGVVDHVDILFFTPIDAGTVILLDPAGEQLETTQSEISSAGLILSVEFDPLVDAGLYTVVHSIVSADGDEQTETYRFTYDAAAPDRLESFADRESGPNWLLLGGIAAAAVVAGALVAPRRVRRGGSGSGS